MIEMLRYPSGVRHDPAIDAWLAARDGELGDLARSWFARMRACGPDVLELMHDGCPVACVADVPFGYVNVFTAHMNVGFYCGALLEDPAGLLEGTGKRMRHVKLRAGTQANAVALGQLVTDAHACVGRWLREQVALHGR